MLLQSTQLQCTCRRAASLASADASREENTNFESQTSICSQSKAIRWTAQCKRASELKSVRVYKWTALSADFIHTAKTILCRFFRIHFDGQIFSIAFHWLHSFHSFHLNCEHLVSTQIMPPKRKVSEPEIKSTEKAGAGARARKQFVPFGSSSTGNEPDSATTTPKKAHKKSASFSMAPLSPDKAAPLVDDIDAEVQAPKSSDSNHDLHARIKALEDKFQQYEQRSEQPKAKKSKSAAATGGEESTSDAAAQVPPKRRQKKVITQLRN
jgi:hypothetical protein